MRSAAVVQDVNAAFSDVQWTGNVHHGRPEGRLPREQLTVAMIEVKVYPASKVARMISAPSMQRVSTGVRSK